MKITEHRETSSCATSLAGSRNLLNLLLQLNSTEPFQGCPEWCEDGQRRVDCVRMGRRIAMSKKSKKAKSKSRDGSLQGSGESVTDKDSISESREPSQFADAIAPESVSNRTVFHSLVPSTQDIDDDWGGVDETEEAKAVSPAPALVHPRSVESASTTPAVRVSPVSTAPPASSLSARSSALLRPNIPFTVSPPPSSERSSTPPPSSERSSTPPPSSIRSSVSPALADRSLSPTRAIPVVAPYSVSSSSIVSPPLTESESPSTVEPLNEPVIEASSTVLASTEDIATAKPKWIGAPARETSSDESLSAEDNSIPALASPSWIDRAPKRRSVTLFAVLWVVTAAIPAIVVWFVMREPKPAPRVVVAAQFHEVRATVPTLSPPVASREVALPSEREPSSTVASADAVTSAIPSVPSEASIAAVAAAVPTVIVTDATERVAVLVESQPKGARIFRLGKEIGRAPLSIEIGRGEHRSFEVRSSGFATRRLALDGGKTKVLVKLALAPKPETLPASPL